VLAALGAALVVLPAAREPIIINALRLRRVQYDLFVK
jgi:hypothetical protein